MTGIGSDKITVVFSLFISLSLIFTAATIDSLRGRILSIESQISGITQAQQPQPVTGPPELYFLQTPEGDRYVPGEFIVKFKKTVRLTKSSSIVRADITSINALNTKFGVYDFKRAFRGKRNSPLLSNVYLLSVPEKSNILSIVGQYKNDPNVEYAEPNYIYEIAQISDIQRPPSPGGLETPPPFPPSLVIPNDPLYNNQWALPKIRASEAWSVTEGSSNVVVAVIDTGVNFNHEDLQGQFWTNTDEFQGDYNGDACPGVCGIDDDDDGLVDEDSQGAQPSETGYLNDLDNDDDENGFPDDFNGWDFYSNDPVPEDEQSHGTGTAGLVAAAGNNGIGMAGICWQCKLMILKFIGPNKDGDALNGGESIVYAADNGAKITSNSWGGPDAALIGDAFAYAESKGVLSVAAAGNLHSNKLYFPADFKGVVKVAATSSEDERAVFSNYGSTIDVAAPGENVLSLQIDVTYPFDENNLYSAKSGTSYATPQVSGLAALLVSTRPYLTNDQLRTILTQGVQEFGKELPVPDKYIGRGVIDMAEALKMQKISVSKAEITSPVKESTITPEIFPVVGTAGGKSYKLEFQKGIYPETWLQISSGTSVTEDVLGLWDTTFAPDSETTLRLTVFDDNGFTEDVSIVTPDNAKIEKPENYDFFNHEYQKIPITGSVKTSSYTYSLDYSVKDANEWSSHGITSSSSGTTITGEWDPSSLSLGIYTLRLKAQYNGVESTDVADVYFGDFHYGWPKKLESSTSGSHPVIADIDGIAGKEILVGSTDGQLHAWHQDGTYASGWPKTVSPVYSIDTSPAVGDIDYNGDMEIAASTYYGVYLWNHDGTPYAGWPASLYSDYINPTFYSSPTLADVTGDGKLEIILGSYFLFPKGKLLVLDASGQFAPGWPQETPGPVYSSPAVGDMDNDGYIEIIAGSDNGNSPGGKLHAWHHEGTPVDGWPIDLPFKVYSSPILIDIDKDGYLEIIMNGNNNLYIWKHDGSQYPGWPVSTSGFSFVYDSPTAGDINGDGKMEIFASDQLFQYVRGFDKEANKLPGWPVNISTIQSSYISSSPDIASIDNDPEAEIIQSSSNSGIYAWNLDGTLVDGWPKPVYKVMQTDVAVGDIDADGDTELVAVTQDGFVIIFDLNVPYYSISMHWPMFHHDPMHSGLYTPPFSECTDNDGDGYGSPGSSSCPNGAQTDCNDFDSLINPGAAEVCDGIDNNCASGVDEGCGQTCSWQKTGQFDTASAGATSPTGIAFDPADNTLWVADTSDDFAYHFSKAGANLGNGFSVTPSGSTNPRGITYDPATNTLWVTDSSQDKAYHFTKAGGSLGSFSLLPNTDNSADIAFETGDNTLWVHDATDQLVYHYSTAGADLTGDFSVPVGQFHGDGIAFDPRDGTFWITDVTDDFAYHYNKAGADLGDGFSISGTIISPYGITFDTTDNSLWIADDGFDEVFHYKYVCT